jgi:predicted dinucleotide-binding enzyme
MAEALGAAFAHGGHQILVGARDSDKAEATAERILPSAGAGTLRDAAEFGEVLLLAVKRAGIAEALRLSGAQEHALAGKTLIDCNNFGPDVDMMSSIAEEIAHRAPGARVVKAFNCCHYEVWKLQPPAFDGRPLVVPICGDDAAAKATVRALIEEMGCRPLDLGGLVKSRNLEALAAIVIGLLFSGFDRYTVFNLLSETPF